MFTVLIRYLHPPSKGVEVLKEATGVEYLPNGGRNCGAGVFLNYADGTSEHF